MTDFTEDGVYKPKTKLAVVLSFEGVFNDGAKECGLVTFNAYRNLKNKSYDAFGRIINLEDPEEYDSRTFLCRYPGHPACG